MDTFESLEIETGAAPRHSVIWLHGLGADGHDFEPIVPELRLPPEHPVRFVFPHAPVRPITVNGGMAMRGWYDVHAVPIDPAAVPTEDRAGIEQSAALVADLVAQENRRGVPTENIFLAGFSQGGAVVLFAGLRYPERFAGLVALSTYLPLAGATADERHAANADTPVFMGSGTEDPVIPMVISERSRDGLTGLGSPVDWHTYPMGHSVHPEEIRDIAAWLAARITGGQSGESAA